MAGAWWTCTNCDRETLIKEMRDHISLRAAVAKMDADISKYRCETDSQITELRQAIADLRSQASQPSANAMSTGPAEIEKLRTPL